MNDDTKRLWENAQPHQRLRVTAYIWDTLWDTDYPPNHIRTWEGTKAQIEAQAADYADSRDKYLFAHMEIADVKEDNDE